MQTVRIVQAVILMTIVALAASCAVGKEYTSKIFAPRTSVVKDVTPTAKTPRFLNIDTVEDSREGWVTTDLIMGRETIKNSITLDNLAQVFPAKKDSLTLAKTENKSFSNIPVEVKASPGESAPVARTNLPGGIRNKRTRE